MLEGEIFGSRGSHLYDLLFARPQSFRSSRGVSRGRRSSVWLGCSVRKVGRSASASSVLYSCSAPSSRWSRWGSVRVLCSSMACMHVDAGCARAHHAHGKLRVSDQLAFVVSRCCRLLWSRPNVWRCPGNARSVARRHRTPSFSSGRLAHCRVLASCRRQRRRHWA